MTLAYSETSSTPAGQEQSLAIKVLINCPFTHNEAVVSTIAAVVQAAVGLEQEESTGTVVIIGGDARHPQTLPLPQQLLLP